MCTKDLHFFQIQFFFLDWWEVNKKILNPIHNDTTNSNSDYTQISSLSATENNVVGDDNIQPVWTKNRYTTPPHPQSPPSLNNQGVWTVFMNAAWYFASICGRFSPLLLKRSTPPQNKGKNPWKDFSPLLWGQIRILNQVKLWQGHREVD